MADFAKVHRIKLAEAERALRARRAERWNMIVEEPLQFDRPMSETAHFITLSLGRDNKLHPADDGSLKVIQDWKERHKDTPDDAFEFPEIGA